MVWIKHYASKLAQAVSVGLDRRFPVCRTGGVTAQEYSKNKDKQDIILINEETIQNKIYVVRGQKVMLDVDLAEIYGY